MGDTKIEWADKTWNPLRGCTKVSAGCRFCYAEAMADRFAYGPGANEDGPLPAGWGHGLVRDGKWTGDIRLVPEKLDEPLRWRKPQRVFVNSMSDLFHEGVPFEYIAAVYGVMAAARQHTFMVLTKRPERALEWYRWTVRDGAGYNMLRDGLPDGLLSVAWEACTSDALHPRFEASPDAKTFGTQWPLPNVILGVSVEDQETADERIPLLLECPAAVRMASAEPLLGPIDFDRLSASPPDAKPPADGCWRDALQGRAGRVWGVGGLDSLDWVIVGGESGPHARPCNVEWIRDIVRQCREAGTSVFVKQLGRDIYENHYDGTPGRRWTTLAHPKGGDPAEWPADLRVQEHPEVRRED